MEWISVKDRLPEYGTQVHYLTCLSNNDPQYPEVITNTVSFWNVNRWGNILAGDVTHWMPLPAPPKQEK